MGQHDLDKRGPDAVVMDWLQSHQSQDVSWRQGDLTSIAEKGRELKEEWRDFYQRVFVDRNHRWMEQILDILRQNRNTMILVGAAHLAGEDSLLQLLNKAGYTPEQVYGIDRPCLPVERFSTDRK